MSERRYKREQIDEAKCQQGVCCSECQSGGPPRGLAAASVFFDFLFALKPQQKEKVALRNVKTSLPVAAQPMERATTDSGGFRSAALGGVEKPERVSPSR